MGRDTSSRRVGVLLIGGAMSAAPFIAMLYRHEAGLVVMAVGLVTVSLLLRDALGDVTASARPWLRLVIGINVALAAGCMALGLWLALGG